jgi:hypothetical protein
MERRALRDPLARDARVEVPGDLGLARGVGAVGDPDVPTEVLALAERADQEPGDLAVLEGDDAGRTLGRPGALDLRPRVRELGQERLHLAVAGVPRREQLGRALDVLLPERRDLHAHGTASSPGKIRSSPGP